MKNKRGNGRDLKKFKFRGKLIILIITAAISLALLLPKEASAYSKGSEKSISTLYMKMINNVISPFKAAGKNDDTSISGLLTLNPLGIIKNEVSCLDDKNFNEEFIKDEVIEQSKVVEQIVINPFDLKDGDIKKQENTVETVGNLADNSKKKILIYHSHTAEAYTPGESRKSDPTQNLVAVGEALTQELQKQGFTVIHDKTVHDLDYNKSYYKSRETISKYYEKYGDFHFVIDMHRDAGPEKEYVTTNINGEDVARLMFVTATEDPRYKAHMNNINSIFEISNKLYPKLFRERKLCTYPIGIKYYNQDLSDNAVLLEVGAVSNNLKEAINSMKYFGRVLAEHINNRDKK